LFFRIASIENNVKIVAEDSSADGQAAISWRWQGVGHLGLRAISLAKWKAKRCSRF